MNIKQVAVTAFVASMVCAADAYPCKTARSVSNVDMVREADAIVRVSAENYTIAPKSPISSTGFDVESDSRIRFKVLEVVHGKVPADLILPGVLVDMDDFNDQIPPYNLVRPAGRRGSCFASSYRSGGQFLLMLKKRGDGEFSVDWYALAPVNEQLHSVNDPWLVWVRKQVKAPSNKSAVPAASRPVARVMRSVRFAGAEGSGQQTPIAILHRELPRVPGRVARSASEFHALAPVVCPSWAKGAWKLSATA
jgi:hypothetical protein